LREIAVRKLAGKRGFGYVLLAVVLISLFYFDGRLIKSPVGVGIGVAALAVGYATGVIALIVSILFSLYAFLLSIPIISAVYAYVAYQLARIHYTVATYVAKKALDRMKWYRKTKARVKNSRPYKLLHRIYNKATKRMGLAEPHILKVFEVADCSHCRKKIPRDGEYCPYCGVKRTQ
jgi:hypothetical protein